MESGLRIGSIAGIEIRVDPSLTFVFMLVTVSLGVGLFPAWHPDWSAVIVWCTAAAAAVLFFGSVLVHELAHALVGRAQDITIRRITLFVFGGMAHLEEEPHDWRAELWMAVAGPVTSFAIGVVCLFLAGLMVGPVEIDPGDPIAVFAALDPLATIAAWLGPVNIGLAVFNLVPGFPLDGGRVARALLWGATGDIVRATRWAAAMGQTFGWMLMAIGFAMILGLRVPYFGTGILNGMWIALIGWFLNNAAIMSYRQLLSRRRPFERVRV
jgi:Zn-dependent protease